MTASQQVLLSVLSRPFGLTDSLDFPCDEQERRGVVEESIKQGVCLAFSDSLRESEKDSGVAYRTLRKYADVTQKRNIEIYEAHYFISKLLTDNDIKHVVIKGIASDRYYKKQFLRTLGDVDIMLAGDDIKAAEALLISNGFHFIKNASTHHSALARNGIRIELHDSIGNLKRGSGTVLNLFYSDNGIIPTAESVKYANTDIPVPNDYFHGLILLLHTTGHIKTEGIGLRHLFDWAHFVSRFENDEFDKAFADTLEKLGLYTLAKALTRACEFIGLKKYAFASDIPDSTARTLIEDILSVGNMGQKNEHDRFSRSNANRNKPDAASSRFGYLLTTLNNHVYLHFKTAKKIKALLPIGYIYVMIRWFILRISGKRTRLDITKSLDSAINRDTIVRLLEL
ncbi:MAG: nucleotidyltransferase family protein [Clostridia bacterium]|nr:nucleotidyltransferase family protein [Clostridia bacterium]